MRVFVPKNKTESKRVANRFRAKTESRDQSCHPNKIQMGDKNPEGLDIYIPGYVFACLLNSSAKSNNFRDGFLLGECNSEEISAISDSQPGASRKVEELTVQDLLCNNSSYSFYDNLGTINRNDLYTKLSGKEKNLVGYYSIRRNTNSAISFRERTILQNMLNMDVFTHKKLLFLLLTPSREDNKATFNLNYKAFVYQNKCVPSPAKINVINLGSGNELHEYIHKSRLLGSKTNPTTQFMKAIQESQSDKFMTQTGSVSLADNTYVLFYKTVSIMDKLRAELSSYDERLEKYVKEINELEQIVSNNSPEKP